MADDDCAPSPASRRRTADPAQEHVLARAIDGLVASYHRHGNINHLDGENLPSRSAVQAILDDLITLLFPGYFVEDQLDELTTRYFVGERIARLLRSLERAILRVLQVGRPQPIDCEALAVEANAQAIELLSALPETRAMLATDLAAALLGDPAAKSAAEVITAYPGLQAIAVHRIAHHLYRAGVPVLPRQMSELIHGRTGIDIHPGATIGSHFFIDHGTGVVIGETSRIGKRVKVYQGVTLGALSVSAGEIGDEPRQRHPTIEDDVTIYAGATILGGDTVIGRGSVIGGNVWLTHGVPPGTTVILEDPSLRFLDRRGDRLRAGG
jgi:serine O-acetyltransferase